MNEGVPVFEVKLLVYPAQFNEDLEMSRGALRQHYKHCKKGSHFHFKMTFELVSIRRTIACNLIWRKNFVRFTVCIVGYEWELAQLCILSFVGGKKSGCLKCNN